MGQHELKPNQPNTYPYSRVYINILRKVFPFFFRQLDEQFVYAGGGTRHECLMENEKIAFARGLL